MPNLHINRKDWRRALAAENQDALLAYFRTLLSRHGFLLQAEDLRGLEVDEDRADTLMAQDVAEVVVCAIESSCFAECLTGDGWHLVLEEQDQDLVDTIGNPSWQDISGTEEF